VWYNLPDAGKYDSVVACTYNIFTEGKGEIISGRITDASDRPVAGAAVKAKHLAGTYTAMTNDKGVYAMAKLPSATAFTIEVQKPGLTFVKRTAETGTSRDWKTTSGNQWGVDFVGAPIADSDEDNDVDFADFAVLAGKPWSYAGLATFVSGWLTGVSPVQNTPMEVQVVTD